MENININNDDKIFELYTLAELAYQNHFKNSVNNIDELFPVGWYEKKSYHLKIQIIYEAIKNNMLIVNTPSYQNFIEGVDKKIKGLKSE